MLTSEEFTRAVFGEDSSWKVIYCYSKKRHHATYEVGIHPASSSNTSYNFFSLIPSTPEEGPEEEGCYEGVVVALVQEFVARLASRQELLKLSPVDTLPHPARQASVLKLWDHLEPEKYTPLERYLLESLPFDDHPLLNLSLLTQGVYSVSNALSLLPTRFTLTGLGPMLQELMEQPSLNEVETRAGVVLPPHFLENVTHYALGTEATRQGLLEVAAFLQRAPRGSYLFQQAQQDWYSLFSLLLSSTPWHPAQRPGESYASLMARGPEVTEAFENLLQTNRGSEDIYRSFRWLQASAAFLTSNQEEVEELVVEWCQPSRPKTVKSAYEAFRLPKKCYPGLYLFLCHLLPHRDEFTEEERSHLLDKLGVESNFYPGEGAPFSALALQRPRLLSHLLEAWGPTAVLRLVLTWPEEEQGITTLQEAKFLASHPEWASLPPSWWLPLLQEERERRDEEEMGEEDC